MDVSGPQYEISCKQLLLKITNRLNLPQPVYSPGILSQNTCYVLLRRNNSPTKADYFQGDEKENYSASEEDAALKAIRFLCRKYSLQICDVNLDQAIMYKKCAEFYQDQAIALENELSEEYTSPQVQPPCTPPVKTVELDFLDFLKDITFNLGAPMSQIDTMPTEPNMWQSCIELHNPNSPENPQYVLGDICDRWVEAEQNVAKKAITQLQSDFKFTVFDVNFQPMVKSWAKCSFFQKKTRKLEERVSKKREDRAARLLSQRSAFNWSPGTSGTMPQLEASPALPPKKRKWPQVPAVCTSSTVPCPVPDDVADEAFPKPQEEHL